LTGVTDFAAAAQSLAATLLASTTDPADAVRMLSVLAAFSSTASVPASSVGVAMTTMQVGCGDLFRRAAVVALCRASTSYEPSSFDDAMALRTRMAALLDAEILIAGDQGADATFDAFRALRTAVVRDLTRRGANLAQLVTVSSPRAVPATVIAQRVYRDSTRADELVIEADPRHPAFMPVSFKALSK
jgi:prophage DNA circulation protein